MPPKPRPPVPGALIKVACRNPDCAQADKEQTVPAGVSLSATVLLTGTLSCAVCGFAVEPLAGNGDRKP